MYDMNTVSLCTQPRTQRIHTRHLLRLDLQISNPRDGLVLHQGLVINPKASAQGFLEAPKLRIFEWGWARGEVCIDI